jgi:hypothetical protein
VEPLRCIAPGLLSSAKEFVSKFGKNQVDANDNSLLELKKTLLFQQPHAFLLRRRINQDDLFGLTIAKMPAISSFNSGMSRLTIGQTRSMRIPR